VLVGASAPSALAQTNAQQKAVAEALFEEANKLMEEGQYGAACERFEQSQHADPGVGTLLNLGRCYALTGRLASSWAIYREAASAARASGQGDRARVAEENARELRPRLSELALLVPPAQPRGYELLLDNNLVSSVQFGLSVPVDAGQHLLVARAPGYEQWSSAIQVGGSAAHKTVQIPSLVPLAADARAPAAPEGAPSPRFEGATPAGPSADVGGSGSWGGQKLTGLIVAGSGLLAVGAGVGFGLHAQALDDDAKKVCGSEGCSTQQGEDLNERARNWATAANLAYVAGGLAVATGAFLFFTAHHGRAQAHSGSWQVVPVLGGISGIIVDGAF
jgi:serine/threonine-protein kinase